jgi:hypothetical protein
MPRRLELAGRQPVLAATRDWKTRCSAWARPASTPLSSWPETAGHRPPDAVQFAGGEQIPKSLRTTFEAPAARRLCVTLAAGTAIRILKGRAARASSVAPAGPGRPIPEACA